MMCILNPNCSLSFFSVFLLSSISEPCQRKAERDTIENVIVLPSQISIQKSSGQDVVDAGVNLLTKKKLKMLTYI
ncbi:hypothetical protein Anas_10965 [Armadillidium nasatum]|uniref:Secreted protein n=1 Tax=Armadillidium nasatum TaxID=96803 RepID=A0A5N5SPT5_9CRUS|nr:hypothetical protein Anas_10965 [Armadillidium nasatum]